MKNHMALALALAALLVFTGCRVQDEDPPSVPPGPSDIRILNSTGWYIDSVQVGNRMYRSLDTGAYSECQSFETAYRYDYIKLYAIAAEYVLQPIDYVGETFIGRGKFTYELARDSARIGLVLNFKTDLP